MDGILDVDRCHGGESGTGRGDDFLKTARPNALGPTLIVDEASPTPNRILDDSRQVLCCETANLAPKSGTAVCLDRKEEKAKAKLLGIF